MKCPHCNGEMELTWKRYWSSPMGNHQCSACEKFFRFKHSVAYYVTVVCIAAVLGVAFAFLARQLRMSFWVAMIVYCAACLALIIPLDRWFDAKWRKTVPFEKEDSPNPG